MTVLLTYYHRLPYPLKVVAASAQGMRLRRWRYGPATEQLVEEAAARETWSHEQWTRWRDETIARLLDRAARSVPYYRDQWASRRRRGDRAPWDDLSNWPVLPKTAPRRNPRAFVAEDCDTRKMFELHTSGSTGSPLTIWISRTDLQRWYALYELRVRNWNGVSKSDRWCVLGGQLVTPFTRTRPPYWVWNAAMGQLYLSSYHLAPDSVAAYAQALSRHRVRYMLGYPSAMHALATAAAGSGVELPRLDVVLGNAEPMHRWQREALHAAFGSPVRHTYGMAETVAAASECPHGTMHQWPEAGHVEYAEDASGVASPRRLVCTGLVNTSMPLIRYEVGDAGLPGTVVDCGCGRTLPRLGEIEGRTDDLIVTPDGRRIGRLDPVFKADIPVREAQIIQESETALRILVVAEPGFSSETERRLRDRLRDRVGDMQIDFEAVESIPRSANGKFKAVVSRLGR